MNEGYFKAEEMNSQMVVVHFVHINTFCEKHTVKDGQKWRHDSWKAHKMCYASRIKGQHPRTSGQGLTKAHFIMPIVSKKGQIYFSEN